MKPVKDFINRMPNFQAECEYWGMYTSRFRNYHAVCKGWQKSRYLKVNPAVKDLQGTDFEVFQTFHPEQLAGYDRRVNGNCNYTVRFWCDRPRPVGAGRLVYAIRLSGNTGRAGKHKLALHHGQNPLGPGGGAKTGWNDFRKWSTPDRLSTCASIFIFHCWKKLWRGTSDIQRRCDRVRLDSKGASRHPRLSCRQNRAGFLRSFQSGLRGAGTGESRPIVEITDQRTAVSFACAFSRMDDHCHRGESASLAPPSSNHFVNGHNRDKENWGRSHCLQSHSVDPLLLSDRHGRRLRPDNYIDCPPALS